MLPVGDNDLFGSCLHVKGDRNIGSFETLSVCAFFFKIDGFQPYFRSWIHKLQHLYLPILANMTCGKVEAGAGLRGEIVGIPTIAPPTSIPSPFYSSPPHDMFH